MSTPQWIRNLEGDRVRARVARAPSPTLAQVAAVLRRGVQLMCVLETGWAANYTPAMRIAARRGWVRVWGADSECGMCWAITRAGRAALDTYDHTGRFLAESTCA